MTIHFTSHEFKIFQNTLIVTKLSFIVIMQEPSSPLIPLDPSRLQQQMQQPMQESVKRTMSGDSVCSADINSTMNTISDDQSAPTSASNPDFAASRNYSDYNSSVAQNQVYLVLMKAM